MGKPIVEESYRIFGIFWIWKTGGMGGINEDPFFFFEECNFI